MAGMGNRFRKVGYKIPKYRIEVKGKTLFEWSLDSLVDYNLHVEKYVFVVQRADNSSEFIKEKCNIYGIENLNIVEIDGLTDGQATTCMLALPFCDKNNPIMVYNIDTSVEPYAMKYEAINGDGHIPCFYAEGDHWSFVRTDNEGKVIEVKEKSRISDNCSLGAYYFSSAELYYKLYNQFYCDNDSIENNERYIAPLYNYMIKKGMKVTMSIVPADKVHVLGTPEELEMFKNSNG